MEQIIHNPYRILGLLVGASAKDQAKQVNRLKQYIDAEQEPEKDFFFKNISNFDRDLLMVEKAESKLNLNFDKAEASIFWFYLGYAPIDEAAFELINENKIDDAIDLYSDFLKKSEYKISGRNFSSFQNLSNLLIIKSSCKNEVLDSLFSKAIDLKIKFIESDFFFDYLIKATDSTYKIEIPILESYFLDAIKEFYEKNSSISNFLKIITQIDFQYKDNFLKTILNGPIENLERKIDEIKAKRKKNPEKANEFANELYDFSKNELQLLGNILDKNNVRYHSISDKVAEEILQCGIEYFLEFKDSDFDPSKNAKNIFNLALDTACGKIIMDRCKENSENLDDWIENKPYRENKKKISSEYEELSTIIDKFMNEADTVANAKLYLNSSVPLLSKIKTILGSSNELYLTLSNRVCSDVQSMCIDDINKLQNRVTSGQDMSRHVALLLLKAAVADAWVLSMQIGTMDLKSDFRNRYNKNHESLRGLKNTLDGLGKKKSEGCYIATMVYGSYEHPKVLILRSFRDNTLQKTFFGRILISIYYFVSPKLVIALKNQNKIHNLIKQYLEILINKIQNEA